MTKTSPCPVRYLPCASSFGWLLCQHHARHGLQLIYVVDFRRSYAFVIAINGSLYGPGAEMSFEASDYALVFGLNMCGEVWLEVFNSNVLKVVGNNMAREVVLEKKNFALCFLKFSIPLLNPVLVEVSSHPCLRIVSVIKPKLGTHLLVESARLCSFADHKRWTLLRPISIRCECVSHPDFFALDS